MIKALDDYLNDPELANEPASLREVHAIRLKISDERKGMTAAEYNTIDHEKAARFLATGSYQSNSTNHPSP